MNLTKELLRKKNVYLLVLILVIAITLGFLFLQKRGIVEGFTTVAEPLNIRFPSSFIVYLRGGGGTSKPLWWKAGPPTMPDVMFNSIQDAYNKQEKLRKMTEFPEQYIRVDMISHIPYMTPNNVLGCEREWEMRVVPGMGQGKIQYIQPKSGRKSIVEKCNVEITPRFLGTLPAATQKKWLDFILNEQKDLTREKRRWIFDSMALEIVRNCAARRRRADSWFSPALRNAYEKKRKEEKAALEKNTIGNLQEQAKKQIQNLADIQKTTPDAIIANSTASEKLISQAKSAAKTGSRVTETVKNVQGLLQGGPLSVVNNALKLAGVDVVGAIIKGFTDALTGKPFEGMECPAGFTEIDQINVDPYLSKAFALFDNPFTQAFGQLTTTSACARYIPGEKPEIKAKFCDDKYVLEPEPMNVIGKGTQQDYDNAASKAQQEANAAKAELDAAEAKRKTSPGLGTTLAVANAKVKFTAANQRFIAAQKEADDNRNELAKLCEMDRDINKKLQLIADWVSNSSIESADVVVTITNFKSIAVANEYLIECIFDAAEYAKDRAYSISDGKLYSNKRFTAAARFYFSKTGCNYSIFGYYWERLDFLYQYNMQEPVNFSPKSTTMFEIWSFAMENQDPNPVDIAKKFTNVKDYLVADLNPKNDLAVKANLEKLTVAQLQEKKREKKDRDPLIQYFNPSNNENLNITYLDKFTTAELKERKDLISQLNPKDNNEISTLNALSLDEIKARISQKEETLNELRAYFNPTGLQQGNNEINRTEIPVLQERMNILKKVQQAQKASGIRQLNPYEYISDNPPRLYSNEDIKNKFKGFKIKWD